ncbi:MAG: response regulator [Candidatus Omnitrophica bacterium]|nr:response regulator [Candidatus Omnitrophota bacterium]
MKYVLAIIEDNGIANALKVVLKERYFINIEVPAKAFQSIIERKPDIIIVDSLYKDISGNEFLEELLKKVPDVPVIAFVETYGPAARKLMNMGVYDVIEKPFDPERLIYTLKRAADYVEAKRTEKDEILHIDDNRVYSLSENTFFQNLSEVFVGNFSNLERLIHAIINLLRIQFSLSGITLFIHKTNEFVFCDGIGMERDFLRNIKFNIESALYRCLMTEKKILQKDRLFSSDLISEMNILQAELILPLFNRDGFPIGFFVFGKRLTGEAFAPETIRFLSTISTYLSIMLDDAFLFQDSLVQKEFQKIILENVPSGIIVIDSDYNVKIFNRQAEFILGKKASQVLNSSVEHLGVEFASRLKEILSKNKPAKREEFFATTLNKWLGMSCDFIKQEDEILGSILIFQDITSAKEMENERRRLEQHRYWQQIAKQLSHEIKNPLVAIKTFACLLPEKYSEESFRIEFYKIVNDEIEKLTTLVEKISRLADEEPLVLSVISYLDILQKIKEKFPSMQIVSKDDTDFSAMADSNKIQEALESLIDFCVQDAGNGGEVKIWLSTDADCYKIVIEEDGRCFDLRSTEEIFQPFSNQLSAVFSLNLAISRKIIEEHKGNVSFETLPDGRKRFVLILPTLKK